MPVIDLEPNEIDYNLLSLLHRPYFMAIGYQQTELKISNLAEIRDSSTTKTYVWRTWMFPTLSI